MTVRTPVLAAASLLAAVALIITVAVARPSSVWPAGLWPALAVLGLVLAAVVRRRPEPVLVELRTLRPIN